MSEQEGGGGFLPPCIKIGNRVSGLQAMIKIGNRFPNVLRGKVSDGEFQKNFWRPILPCFKIVFRFPMY